MWCDYVLFFKQKTAYEMRISDWSSGVCSSDLPSPKFGRLPTGKKGLGKLALFGLAKQIVVDTKKEGLRNRFTLNWDDLLASSDTSNPEMDLTDSEDRKSVVSGKSVSVRVDLGGRRLIKKKKHIKIN